MNLAVSNIAWDSTSDLAMYDYLRKAGYQGVEIAPTRIFPHAPYNQLTEASEFSGVLKDSYNLVICSMQSIWYGKQEKLFASEAERKILLDYTKKAIDFARVTGCKNLVFGCPKNRVIQDETQYSIAIDFFNELGNYAYANNTVLAIEPNPQIYNTNFINTTEEAFALCRELNNTGIAVNVDFGTIIENSETLEAIEENIKIVNHIHISEPNLVKLEKRALHRDLAKILKHYKYEKFVSIEMKKYENIAVLKEAIDYIREVYS